MKKLFLITLLTLAGMFASAFLFFFVRQTLANREIERERESVPTIVPVLQTTSRLEIIPLYEEAGAGAGLIIGHGVSYLIRTDAATILMDVGHNPDQLDVAPFAYNMQKLGIDWDEIDRIVISHPHPDHIGGLAAWRQDTVAFGELPGGMGERLVFVPADMTFEGAVHVTIPTLPGPDIATTGVISYAEVFPVSLFEPKGGEQALVVHVADEGLVLITGDWCNAPRPCMGSLSSASSVDSIMRMPLPERCNRTLNTCYRADSGWSLCQLMTVVLRPWKRSGQPSRSPIRSLW
jgi:hypothetical protein